MTAGPERGVASRRRYRAPRQAFLESYYAWVRATRWQQRVAIVAAGVLLLPAWVLRFGRSPSTRGTDANQAWSQA